MKRKSINSGKSIVGTIILSMMLFTSCNSNKHQYSSDWKYDSQNHWHECTVKDHTDTTEKLLHTFDNGVVTKEATEESEGVKTFTCTDCGYKKTEAIEVIKKAHQYSSDYQFDEVSHWHACTVENHTDTTEKEDHEYDNPMDTDCNVCGYVRVVNHTFTTDWSKDETSHWHACTEDGHTDIKDEEDHEYDNAMDTDCNVCGYVRVVNHTFSTDWSKDETNHWHVCTEDGHTDTSEKLPHVFNDGVITAEATEESEGVKTFTCTDCGYEKTEPISKLPHTHKYDMTKWVNTDSTGHYRPTTCGHEDKTKDFAAHEGTWTVKTVATYGVNRVDKFDCTVCGYHEEKEIENSMLSPKARTITVGDLSGMVFNGKQQPIDSKVEVNGDATGLKIEYRVKGEETYSTEAPTEADTYEYRISLDGNVEWQEASVTGEFTIAQLEITLDITTFEIYDSNILDDYIFLDIYYQTYDGTPLSDATNIWTDSVDLCMPLSYNKKGTQTVPFSDLFFSDDNFKPVSTSTDVTVIYYDDDPFLAQIDDTTTQSGNTVISTTIKRGTVRKKDTIYVYGLNKTITVTSIEKNSEEITKATIGDSVYLTITGAEASEITNKMLLAKENTLSSARSAFVTITIYEDQTLSLSATATPSIYLDCVNYGLKARLRFPSTVDRIYPGETVENVMLEFEESILNWEGRNFTIQLVGYDIGSGSITSLHTHSFDASGECDCGSTNTTALTFSSTEITSTKSYYSGELQKFTTTLISSKISDSKYKFELLDSNSNEITDGSFEFKVISTLTNKEITLTNGYITLPKSTAARNRPIEIQVSRSEGLSGFSSCTLKISFVVA